MASELRIQWTDPVNLTLDPERHYGFPRMVRAANGDLLLFYRLGVTHAQCEATIALLRSTDDGATWSDERIVWRPEQKGHGAHNPVALVTPSGRVILWVSELRVDPPPSVRLDCSWSVSDDHGATWAPSRLWDANPDRTSYYTTDAIRTADGLLAVNATFPPEGMAGGCYDVVWHSADDGEHWSVRSEMTSPDENRGDEVALLERESGEILCLLRDRRHEDIYRLTSADGGRTWSEPEGLRARLGCVLQRPFFTRLGGSTLLLSGRDAKRKQVVAYVSRDDGETFGGRAVIEAYKKDGAYTTAAPLGDGSCLMAWYSDADAPELKPDIKIARFSVTGAA